MSATGSTIRRSNKDVAQAMLISGIALLGVALASTLIQNWIAETLYERLNILYTLWQVVISFRYSLGPALIVGSIIVSRLPERPSE